MSDKYFEVLSSYEKISNTLCDFIKCKHGCCIECPLFEKNENDEYNCILEELNEREV